MSVPAEAELQGDGTRKRPLQPEVSGQCKVPRLETLEPGTSVVEPGEAVLEGQAEVRPDLSGNQLARAGLAGLNSSAAVKAQLENLALHSYEFLTNGLLLQLLDAYSPWVQSVLIRLLVRVLGIDGGWVDKWLRDRFRRYFMYSLGKYRCQMEEAPDQLWLYLPWLKPGGRLHRPELLLPPTAPIVHPLSRLTRQLAERGEVKARCGHCSRRDYMPVCACLRLSYCNMICRQLDTEHTAEECAELEDNVKVGAVLPSADVLEKQQVERQLEEQQVERQLERQLANAKVAKLKARMARMRRATIKKNLTLLSVRRENIGLRQRALHQMAGTVVGPSEVVLNINPGQQVFKVSPIKLKGGSKLKLLEAVHVKPVEEPEPAEGPEPAEPEPADGPEPAEEALPAEQPLPSRGRGPASRERPRERDRGPMRARRRQDRHTLINLGQASKPFSEVKHITVQCPLFTLQCTVCCTGPQY